MLTGTVILLTTITIIGLLYLCSVAIINTPPSCRKCGRRYDRFPTKSEFRLDCKTEGCYWMLFSDGGQTHDYPGE